MADQAQRSCGELAYGDLKRLELAIALANDPKLLLMDEPAAGMAPRERHALMGLTADIARERTIGVLFTEHDMDVVFGHADRVLVLNRGALIAEGAPAAVRANAEVQAVYLGAGSLYGAHSLTAAKLSVAELERRLWSGAGAVRRLARRSQPARRSRCSAATAQANRRCSVRSSGSSADRSGKVVFDGEDISNRPPYEIVRRGLGYVPEDRRIFSDLTVEENLLVGRQPPRPDAPTWTLERLFAIFPNLRELREARRRANLGRRAADADDRAHAHGQSLASASRRAVRRPRPPHRRADDRGDSRNEARRPRPFGQRAEPCFRAPRRRANLCDRKRNDPLCGNDGGIRRSPRRARCLSRFLRPAAAP